MNSLKSKFLGGMIGSALGDAIGELAFRRSDETSLRAAVARAGVLAYTDDTAMSIGLAETLVQTGGLDEQRLGDTLMANHAREPWRGYASGPPTIFSMVKRGGLAYTEAARSLFSGQGSFGNGAAMRIAPVGLFFHASPNLYERARQSAVVTHAHPIGIDGAAVLAWAIAQAAQLDPRQPLPLDYFYRGLGKFAQTPEMRRKLVLIPHLIAENAPAPQAAERLGQSVVAHESVPFALYAFLRHPQSFEDCLMCAILNGGDRDTLGAMACAISGAFLGIQAIPQAWRDKLENGPYIQDLALKLAEMHAAH